MDTAIISALLANFGTIKTTKPQAILHGYANEVYLLPLDDLVLRIPRNEWAAKRQKEEAELLKQLASVELGFEISHLRQLSTDPAFMVTSYIDGKVFSREHVAEWSEHDKVSFGQNLGTFLWNLHTRADKNTYENIIFPKPNLLSEFQRDISRLEGSHSHLYTTAINQLEILHDMVEGDEHKQVVIHGDIHAANIVFDTHNTMIGVLDFADMSIESCYVDFRRVFMLDEVVFDACIDTYELLEHTKINRHLAKQWAIVHELSVLCRHYDEPNYPSIPRATEHIKQWLS